MRLKALPAAFAALYLSVCLTACSGSGPDQVSSQVSSAASEAAESSEGQAGVFSAVSSSSYPVPENDPLYVKAYGYYADGKYDSAVSVADQALAADPNCFWAYNIKGIATYFANGNSVADECIALIDKSLAIDPEYLYGYFNKALILKGLKRYDESIVCFKKAIEYGPKDTWSFYGIATCYADMNEVDQALAYLQKAIELDPSGVKAQVQDDIDRHFSKMRSDPRFKALVYS